MGVSVQLACPYPLKYDVELSIGKARIWPEGAEASAEKVYLPLVRAIGEQASQEYPSIALHKYRKISTLD